MLLFLIATRLLSSSQLKLLTPPHAQWPMPAVSVEMRVVLGHASPQGLPRVSVLPSNWISPGKGDIRSSNETSNGFVKAGVKPDIPWRLDVKSTYVETNSCAEIVFPISVVRTRRKNSNISTSRETVIVMVLP
jgi:hypothetical protein